MNLSYRTVRKKFSYFFGVTAASIFRDEDKGSRILLNMDKLDNFSWRLYMLNIYQLK